MKKKIVIIGILILIALVAIILPKTLFKKSIGEENEGQNQLYNVLVYVQDKNNRLVGLNVGVNELKEDQIRQKWELLTTEKDKLPENYTSMIPENTVLNDYTIDNECLTLDVSGEIQNGIGRKTVETIAWTFINDEIEKVKLVVDGTEINEIGDYTYKEITKKMGINLSYETMHIFEANYTTILYQEDSYLLPVTYFHLEEDITDFIVMKALEQNELGLTEEVYNYTLNDNIITIDFVDASILTNNQIATIAESIAFNLQVNSLNINNNENLFYQRVYVEITEE